MPSGDHLGEHKVQILQRHADLHADIEQMHVEIFRGRPISPPRRGSGRNPISNSIGRFLPKNRTEL